MKVYFFHSNEVSWKQGFVKVTRARWHSCMQWGWPSLNRGEHMIEWYDYWVLSFKIGTRGVSWQFYPYERTEGRKR